MPQGSMRCRVQQGGERPAAPAGPALDPAEVRRCARHGRAPAAECAGRRAEKRVKAPLARGGHSRSPSGSEAQACPVACPVACLKGRAGALMASPHSASGPVRDPDG